jgi:hypothetical protein
MNSSFFIAGPGIASRRDLGQIDMRDIAPTLAELLGVPLPSAEGRNWRSMNSCAKTQGPQSTQDESWIGCTAGVNGCSAGKLRIAS